jgi:hypothetical protein
METQRNLIECRILHIVEIFRATEFAQISVNKEHCLPSTIQN